jgi:hypothetical protein
MKGGNIIERSRDSEGQLVNNWNITAWGES